MLLQNVLSYLYFTSDAGLSLLFHPNKDLLLEELEGPFSLLKFGFSFLELRHFTFIYDLLNICVYQLYVQPVILEISHHYHFFLVLYRAPFPPCHRVWELRVLLLQRDRSGVHHSWQGEVLISEQTLHKFVLCVV